MTTAATEERLEVQTFQFSRDTLVAAGPDIVFDAVLAECGPESTMPDGKPFPFKLEAWPGGRWFRDVGNDAGHLWGHVQVIKPPKLLEIWGPLMMSFPAVNHIQYRLTAEGATTRLKLTHRAMGLIDDETREGMTKGFAFWVQRMKQLAEGRRR